ncbi:MAG: GGDEF domain-containing protein [Actinomycetota bacterium]|nr:GGDEF domain-containing protein [Actinomycetota bacterium]
MKTGGKANKGIDVAKIEQLEAHLAEAEAENAVLRLQLDMLTSTDIVTGLPNANGIIEQLQKAGARYSRSGEAFGVMFVGFPAFERIVEERGRRDVEDAMRHAGALVGACLRQIDTVGRVDDDGLVCVMPMMGDDGVSPVVHRVEKVLNSSPMVFEDGDEINLVPAFTVVVARAAGRVDPPSMMKALIEARPGAAPGTPVIRYASSS